MPPIHNKSAPGGGGKPPGPAQEGAPPIQDQPRGASEPRALTAAEEAAREECRVLREVLSIYPESLTLEELIRELTSGSPELSKTDAVQVAVLELVGCGLAF